MNNASILNNEKRRIVIAIFAHGAASKKAKVEAVEAPF